MWRHSGSSSCTALLSFLELERNVRACLVAHRNDVDVCSALGSGVLRAPPAPVVRDHEMLELNVDGLSFTLDSVAGTVEINRRG
ncbi:hypothetical protein DQ04_00931000 [Trypanosoma grayi]|uniref:hypothetical protein n=1 Tax=Trypanosoma grayi TaxID=71804 RepID=UPI0004F47482|nr:hypothetical protein DQ04_00931000 [Trypanosoma grayi]KEG13552.1 hypothetical protein DQ04_00931000 [Trypanosoma grayi]